MADQSLTISEISPSNGSYIMDSFNCWLMETYGLKYNKTYKLYKENGEYSLYLHMNNEDRPYIIAGQFNNDDQFLSYLKKDFQDNKIFLGEYFILYRTDENKQV